MHHLLRSFCSIFLLFVCVLLYSLAVVAQSGSQNGRIEGTVFDASGAALPDASITARNQATGISAQKSSDAGGHFIFLYLVPGTYEVSLEKAGFKSAVLKDVPVNVGTTTNIEPRLAVGGVQTNIEVSASAPLVDSSQSSLGAVISERSIENLPLNGRNFTDFVLLTPGASTDGDFGMVSFNGIAGNFNNYTVDGANDNNAFFSQQVGRTSIPYQFSEDVIQEFQVNTTGFEAEFGQAGGGLVNTVTKSGGNQVHGDGYYYILDSALNANDSINKTIGIAKPSNRRQQFGGTVGGPIRHDRLFYLGNYESQIRNEPVTVNNTPALGGLSPAFIAANPGLIATIKAASGSFPRSFDQNVAFFKLSGLLTPRNTFSASYNYQRFRSPHGYFNTPTSTGDGLALTDGATSHFLQITLQSALTPTAENELRLHVGNDAHFDLPPSPATGPAITIQNPDTGFVYGGNRFQLSTGDRRYEVSDNFTKSAGRHTFKTGVDLNINHDRDYFVYGPKGEYRFADLPGVATGSFQLYLQAFGQSTAKLTSPSYSFFAQDQFRATPSLTLNYGLRYDLQALPQPKVCNPGFKLTCRIPFSKNNFSPRVGFAYKVGGAATTVVKGAFGIFFIQENLLDVAQALLSNGISRQFLATTGPGFGNTSPIVTFPNSLSSFPTGAGGTPALVVFAPNFRSPYVEQANLAVEHQFGAHTSVNVGYVFSHGVALLGNANGVTRQANGNFLFDLNLVPPAQQPAFGTPLVSDSVTLPNGKTFIVPDFEAVDGLLSTNFGAINAIDNSGKSFYNAMLVSFKHQSSRFQGGLAYTLSKTIDQGTGYFNQFDQQSQRGLSQLDQRHRLVLNGAWFPQSTFLKGFILAGVASLASGRPYTATFDTPQLNFSIVPGEGFNSFTGPGVETVDLSIARLFKFNERVGLRLVAEGYNLFNHANFQQNAINTVQYRNSTQVGTNAAGDMGFWTTEVNPGFGKPVAMVSRYGSRNFQFSARVTF